MGLFNIFKKRENISLNNINENDKEFNIKILKNNIKQEIEINEEIVENNFYNDQINGKYLLIGDLNEGLKRGIIDVSIWEGCGSWSYEKIFINSYVHNDKRYVNLKYLYKASEKKHSYHFDKRSNRLEGIESIRRFKYNIENYYEVNAGKCWVEIYENKIYDTITLNNPIKLEPIMNELKELTIANFIECKFDKSYVNYKSYRIELTNDKNSYIPHNFIDSTFNTLKYKFKGEIYISLESVLNFIKRANAEYLYHSIRKEKFDVDSLNSLVKELKSKYNYDISKYYIKLEKGDN